jgi:hypothetical protein
MTESVYRPSPPGEGQEAAEGKSPETLYRVIFEGLKPNESKGSFAIKYGILTSTPVTKVKMMLRDLPRTFVETRNGPKARSALELIEEAGGVARIEDFNLEEKAKVEITEEEPTIANTGEKSCLKCGFPLKDGDEYCQFCHTSVEEKKSDRIKTVLKAGGGGHLVNPRRLAIYIVLLVLAILWDILAG